MMRRRIHSVSLALLSTLIFQHAYAGSTPLKNTGRSTPSYKQEKLLTDGLQVEEGQNIDKPERAQIDYRWPANLFEESQDMADAAFLVYTFAYLLSVARDVGLEGVELSEKGEVMQKEFTPFEVRTIIENNEEVLEKYFPGEFKEGGLVRESLSRLQERVEQSDMERPLTLEHFDDKHQQHEMVYGVAKDDINRRITLVFRGTENELAFKTNWLTNLSVAKKFVPLPSSSKGKIFKNDGIWIHSGFYGYMFEETFDDSDDPNLHKYDEVLRHVKTLLKENPDYKLYVTGHSLGGALSSLASFFMASDPEITKPVSCLNFAAPRIGDENYLNASRELENAGHLRICRVINDKDSIPLAPMFNYYHAGFQVRLYNDASNQPEISYPKLKESRFNRFRRMWANSIIKSFNFAYDHGEYRERIEENKEALEKFSLNELYEDSNITGFK